MYQVRCHNSERGKIELGFIEGRECVDQVIYSKIVGRKYIEHNGSRKGVR